jgi:hypothetical protein
VNPLSIFITMYLLAGATLAGLFVACMAYLEKENGADTRRERAEWHDAVNRIGGPAVAFAAVTLAWPYGIVIMIRNGRKR